MPYRCIAKKNLTYTDLVCSTPRNTARSIVPRAQDGFFVTLLLTAQTERIRSYSPVRLRRCTSLYHQIKDPSITDLVRLTSLSIARSAVNAAPDNFFATFVPLKWSEKIESDESVRSHLSVSFHRRKRNPTLTGLLHPTHLTISRSRCEGQRFFKFQTRSTLDHLTQPLSQ